MNNVFRNDRLIALRKERGLSTIELAKAIGVAQQTVTKWENRQANPSRDKISKLSHFFDTSMDYLMDNSDKRKSDNYFSKLKNNKNIDELLTLLDSLTDDQISTILTIAKSFSKK